jgi:predicted outer membrane repeat protein
VLVLILVIGMVRITPADPVLAASFIVTNKNDSGPGSLRQALFNAVSGDTITFAPSLAGQTNTLTSTLLINKDLTMDGSGLASRVSISGNDNVSVLLVDPGVTLTIKSLIIRNGKAINGGGIYNNGGTLNVTDSLFTANNAISDPYFVGNGEGGAIYSRGGLTLTNTTFDSNNASRGGALSCMGGTIAVTDSTYISNSALSDSGGDGGAIYENCNLAILNSTFSANTAAHYGGAVLSDNDINPVEITNSTFYGNTALSGSGGAIANYGGLVIRNSTFSNNNASNGGALRNGIGGILSLRNSILANSIGGVDCLKSDGSPAIENLNNLIETTGADVESCGTPLLSIDPRLGALGANGGFTQTMALRQGSPAINAGDDARCPATDQRGISRPYGSHCDLGAYEYDKKNGNDATGVFRPTNGALYLKNQNTTGFADVQINYGIAGDYPIVGDWDGNGTVTIGIYRNGSFYLRNENTIGFADTVFPFGQPGDQPVAGDWDGDGITTVGVYRNGTFFLRNQNNSGAPSAIFGLGIPGDVGIAGDWDGDGKDTTGVFRPSNGALYLKNQNTTGFADVQINYGIAGDKPVTGDWDNDGVDTIGVYRNGQFLLRNSNTIGFAEIVFGLGIPGDMPIAGNWDGKP